jgi:hypothetical protein
MSVSEVLDRFGTAALLRFLVLVLVFVVLHLARMPLLLVARVLEAGMSRVDSVMVAGVSRPTGPGWHNPRR